MPLFQIHDRYTGTLQLSLLRTGTGACPYDELLLQLYPAPSITRRSVVGYACARFVVYLKN